MAAEIISGIYAIVNRVTGKRYYGSSMNCRTRKLSHWGYLRRGEHNNSHLQRAWNKYGEASFEFIIVEVVPVELLKQTEQKYLDGNPDGYNIEPNAAMSGGIRSDETRKKISETLKGYKRSADEIAKSAAARRGIPCHPDKKLKVSSGLKRYFKAHPQPSTPKTEDHKRKVSEGLRRYFEKHPEARLKSKERLGRHLSGASGLEIIRRRSESIRKFWGSAESAAARDLKRQKMLGSSRKLTADDVREIASLLNQRTVAEIASQFNVTIDAIYSIRCGKNWSWITGIVRTKKVAS